MFQVGDKIVHPMHGAGIVESIVQKKVNGVMRDYYVLKLPVRAMVVMIPTDNSEEIGVRPIVDREQADQVLAERSAGKKGPDGPFFQAGRGTDWQEFGNDWPRERAEGCPSARW